MQWKHFTSDLVGRCRKQNRNLTTSHMIQRVVTRIMNWNVQDCHRNRRPTFPLGSLPDWKKHPSAVSQSTPSSTLSRALAAISRIIKEADVINKRIVLTRFREDGEAFTFQYKKPREIKCGQSFSLSRSNEVDTMRIVHLISILALGYCSVSSSPKHILATLVVYLVLVVITRNSLDSSLKIQIQVCKFRFKFASSDSSCNL